jgi:hypothetical protein
MTSTLAIGAGVKAWQAFAKNRGRLLEVRRHLLRLQVALRDEPDGLVPQLLQRLATVLGVQDEQADGRYCARSVGGA